VGNQNVDEVNRGTIGFLILYYNSAYIFKIKIISHCSRKCQNIH
jgi:hypothetical protein